MMETRVKAFNISLSICGILGTVLFGLFALFGITIPNDRIIEIMGLPNAGDSLFYGRCLIVFGGCLGFCFIELILYFLCLIKYNYAEKKKKKQLENSLGKIIKIARRSHKIVGDLQKEILREEGKEISGQNELFEQAKRVEQSILMFYDYKEADNSIELDKYRELYNTAYTHYQQEILNSLGRKIVDSDSKKKLDDILSESCFGAACVSLILSQIQTN